MAHATPAAAPFDPLDPHGTHAGHHHGHVIVPTRVLLGVLLALLVFTILTVAAAQAEEWFSATFHVAFPQLLNVAIALSIAVIKSILVAMYFMQLKYDDPLNSIIFLFCLFAFGLFLFFAMTDMGSRGALYSYKQNEIIAGGTGLSIPQVNTDGKPIVIWARERKVAEIRAEVAPVVERIASGAAPQPGSDLEALVRRVIADMKEDGQLTDLEIQKDLVITNATEAEYEHLKALAHGHHAEPEPAFLDRSLPANRPKPDPHPFATPTSQPAAEGGHGH